MKYLLMIYENEKAFESLPEADLQRVMGEYGTFTEALHTSGHFIAGEELEPTAAATTVRIRDGKRLTTDGPFAETREQLGGFFLVEARDLDEAIGIASRIPSARHGSIEVRPVREFTPPEA
uniref:YCII-related protein n=1 Tax=Myxococcus fulvus TaxID=33 RepID=A0A7D5NFC6_MYXFU|nr:YCII-related protein [Myxococcus fulvus]QLH55522.1 YCII-related protein [Myxococcus sp.]